MNPERKTAILLLSCPDKRGLVSRISNFIFERGGNILDLFEHVESDEKTFSIRVAWDTKEFTIKPTEIEEAFAPLAREFNAEWKLSFAEEKIRTAIFVSSQDHCLQEILWRYSLNELNIQIPLIISNHLYCENLAAHHKIPFHLIPISVANKSEQEQKELKLLADHNIDTIILARYMQILTGDFVSHYPSKIINIHHSFLPSFIGQNPYKQAYDRGVKIIGATSHYVTEELDEGPIIEQDIIRITHKDTVNDLIRKGRDLERLVLARALQYHSEHRVLVRGKKTLVFS